MEAKRIETLLAEDRRGDAVEYFCLSVGMPREVVEGMRHTPRWAELEAMAPTMAYDSELMDDIGRGATVPDRPSRPREVRAPRPHRRGEPGVDDRRRPAARRSCAEQSVQSPGGPRSRRAPRLLAPVLTEFLVG